MIADSILKDNFRGQWGTMKLASSTAPSRTPNPQARKPVRMFLTEPQIEAPLVGRSLADGGWLQGPL